MSAELLKRAATTLREHANAAARGMGTSAWTVRIPSIGDTDTPSPYKQEVTNDRAVVIAECFEGSTPTFAPYIALMHPPVALALADWLDAAAEVVEAHGEYSLLDELDDDQTAQSAATVARAILRETS